MPSYPLAHPRRYAASVLNNILGGSMSSRLFQNIRERQGLAYAVFSELNPYSDAGMLSVYAGTSRSTIERVLRLIAGEFARLKEEPVAEEELRRAKDQLKGSLVLSLESSGARMSNLARQEMYFGRFFSVEELHASIEAVTARGGPADGAGIFRPRENCRHRRRPARGLPPDARSAGLLKLPITTCLEFIDVDAARALR